MSFQLTCANGVFRKGEIVRQTAIYTGYGGRFSVRILGPSTQKRRVQLVTNRDTPNTMANIYAPHLVPAFDKDGRFLVHVQVPHHNWDMDNIDAGKWSIIAQELELGIAAAKEIEEGFNEYFQTQKKG